MWVLALVVVFLLLIPLVSIILDSEIGRALAHRLEPRAPEGGEIERRLRALEDEMEYLSEAVRSLQAQARGTGSDPGGGD